MGNDTPYTGVVARIPSESGKVLAPDNPCRSMPHKHNEKRRHHIPKMKFKVTTWAEYHAGLRRRGRPTLWVTDEAIAGSSQQRV